MAGLISTGIAGFIASAKFTGKQIANKAGKLVPEVIENFVSGFSGHGWKIWEYIKGRWMLEIDSIRVRGQFIIFELLVSKIRAIIGSQAITQGHGKIKKVALSEDGSAYLIELEDDTVSIVEYDFIRCQNDKTAYHVEVLSVVEGVIRISTLEFEHDHIPLVGDEIVQFGNSSHDEKYAGRHSAIYMHADESGQPAIDVMFDIYSKNWTGCVKVRIGGDIPGTNGLKGFYCENGMIKGVNSTGHTVYCIYPDGSAMFGDGSAQFNADKSGHIAGGAIAWERDADTGKYFCTMKGVVLTWDNLNDEAKDNLKGEAAVVYELIPNAEIITMHKNGQFYPSSVHCQVKKTVGPVSSFMTAEDISADGLKYGWERDDSGFFQITPEDSVTPHNDCFPIVFHLKRDDVSICRKRVVTVREGADGSDGVDGEDGRPGADANLLPWVEQWDNNKTLIDGEYVVSPKMFSGTKSPDGKLTGVAQGKDCITIDGVKRTGIFALVDNDIVFELDPINKKYKFKGRIEAESGLIGNLSISSNGDIIGTDESGSPRIFITSRDIEDIDTITNGESYYEPSVDRTANYKEFSFHNASINTPQSVEVLLNDVIDGFMTFYAHFNVFISPFIDLQAEPEYLFSVKYTIELYKKIETSYVFQRKIIDSAITQFISYENKNKLFEIPISDKLYNTTVEDEYKLVLKVDKVYSNKPMQNRKLSITLCPSNQSFVQTSLPAATLIGNNGITSYWGNDAFFTYTKDKGMTCIQGSSGFRVISGGVQKLQYGIWVNL